MIEQFMKKIELPATEISMDGGRGHGAGTEKPRTKEKPVRKNDNAEEQRQAGEEIKPEEPDLDQKQKEAK